MLAFTAILCIALGAGAAAALNMWWEADIDALMKRTASRPLPAGRMERQTALHFGVGLGVFSVLLMGVATNWLAAAILAALDPLLRLRLHDLAEAAHAAEHRHRRRRRRLPAGDRLGGGDRRRRDPAADPALRPDLPVDAAAFLGARRCSCRSDYAKAGVPMLPVVAGAHATRIQILLYTRANGRRRGGALGARARPGAIYGIAAALLSGFFLLLAVRVLASRATDPKAMKAEKRLFAFSILYLFAIFGALVADRWIAS